MTVSGTWQPGYGPLILLGSEGLQESSRQVWDWIRSRLSDSHTLLIIPAAFSQRKLSAGEYRLRVIRDGLAGLGFTCETLPLDGDLTHLTTAANRVTYLPGGDPRVARDWLATGSRWQAIADAQRSGSPLIAAAGAGAALGMIIGRPTTDQTTWDIQPGLGYLPFWILPLCNHLPATLRDRARHQRDMPIIGLDENAALVWQEEALTTIGQGGVTVIRADGSEAVYYSYQTVRFDS